MAYYREEWNGEKGKEKKGKDVNLVVNSMAEKSHYYCSLNDSSCVIQHTKLQVIYLKLKWKEEYKEIKKECSHVKAGFRK